MVVMKGIFSHLNVCKNIICTHKYCVRGTCVPGPIASSCNVQSPQCYCKYSNVPVHFTSQSLFPQVPSLAGVPQMDSGDKDEAFDKEKLIGQVEDLQKQLKEKEEELVSL